MAILFSKVMMRDDYDQTVFFVNGFPKGAEDLEGWKAYHSFLGEIGEDTVVNIHAEAYLYGEGEAFKATPEEVAYMIMRQERDPDFLADRCRCIGESNFNISWCPGELFGQGFMEP